MIQQAARRTTFDVGDRVRTLPGCRAFSGLPVMPGISGVVVGDWHEPEYVPVELHETGTTLRLSIEHLEQLPADDSVNHPSYYADGWSNGAEIIDITEHLNFCRGNAVKYIARAGRKDPDKELEDLQKAAFYIQREIERLRE